MTPKTISSKKLILAFILLILLTVLVLALRPLPKASEENCTKHSGIVLQVLEGGGEGDIVIRIKDDKNYYYINRGIDQGLSVSALKEKLVNKNVELLTIKHWTPLDPASRTKHIARVIQDGMLLYAEL